MKLIKRLISLVFMLGFLAVIVAVAGFLWLSSEMSKPGPLAQETVVTVKSGETLSAVATRLENQGILHSARPLLLKAKLDGTDLAIKSGEFVIPAESSAAEVLSKLVEGKAVLHKIALPEGRTTAQLLKTIADNKVLKGEMPKDPVPEGSLLPDTYLFNRGMTRIQLIEKMQAEQKRLIDELWEKRQADLPIKTKEEAIILASVVEKETGIDGEREMIAGLFTTRLKRGMRLESDPTIIYGVSKGEPLYHKDGRRRTLFRSEIDRKTDWNTYQIDGLPKTPICNPGREAIEAVLNPHETGHIFFVADGKGGHLFAKTLAEHNRNVAAYRRYEREEIARERSGE